MSKKILYILISFIFFSSINAGACYAQEQISSNPLVKFLKEIEYTSRLKFEHDDNIFLREKNADSDFRNIFTQSLTYRLPKDDHYFQWRYRGNYAYYTQEATGVLGHTANVLYSYRPFSGFSIGIRDDFNWLQDSIITTTIGDRFLSLGYVQNMPSLQVKYEMNPRLTLTSEAHYQFLDVRDKDSDDYIDNKRIGVSGQANYSITSDQALIGFVGFEHKQVAFSQISEKSAVSDRAFFGCIKKFINLFNLTTEIGFDNIEMDDNADDDNMDLRASIETTFSLFTKVKLSFTNNLKKPSLRKEYTQYGSTAGSFDVNHSIDPKTSININYSYERQDFNSSDALTGQPNVDRKTDIHETKLTLTRKLNKWLSCDFVYDYTQRDTDFAPENYTNNKFSVSLTAKY